MSLIRNNPERKKPTLGDGHSSLHHTTKRLLSFEKNAFMSTDAFQNQFKSSLNAPTDKSFSDTVLKSYRDLYNHHQLLTNEEKLINRMERKAQIRNTLFRGVTTLTIGFSIMIVYCVASELGISMPLIRVPL